MGRLYESPNSSEPNFLQKIVNGLTSSKIERKNQDPIRKTLGILGEKGFFGPLPSLLTEISARRPETTQPIAQFAGGANVIPFLERLAVGERTPESIKQQNRGYRVAGGATTGLVTGGVAPVAASTAIGGTLGAGVKAVENVIKKQPVTKDIGKAAKEGAMYGAETSPTFILTQGIVNGLASKIPFLKPLTETALKEGAVKGTETLGEAMKKIGSEGFKRVVKATILETPLEGLVYGERNQRPDQKLLDSIAEETVKNFVFNVGFAGINTAWDNRMVAPIIKKSLDQVLEKYPQFKPENFPIGFQAKSVPGSFEESLKKLSSEQLQSEYEKAAKAGSSQEDIIAKEIQRRSATGTADTGVARPQHQIDLEQASKAGDVKKVKEILDSIPADDPYKQSMESAFKNERLAAEQLEQTSGQPTSTLPAGNQPPDSTDPVQKIIVALQEAKPLRKQQQQLYSQELAKRSAAVSGVGESVPGEAGYYAQLGQLKGELPKVEFTGIRNQVTQNDIDTLFNRVEASNLLPFEKVSAKTGLSKLLGAEGGQVPTNSEMKLLNEVFPSEFVKEVLNKRSTMQKMLSLGGEVLNVPKAVMASTDFSAPFRQGLFLIGRPKQWVPATRDMFKYFLDEDAYDDLFTTIQAKDTYPLMREAKLALTDMKKADLNGKEEAFMSNLAEQIPVIGGLVKASDRAYTGFLNKLRADVFDNMITSAQKEGIEITPELVQSTGKFVNAATGRGDLPDFLKGASVGLNATFFSPRLMASRLSLLRPDFYVRLDPFVQKEAIKSLFSFAGVGLTALALAKLGGAQVSTDPTNADFGKIRVGDTRYDIWGGFQQYLTLAARLISGKTTSSITGKEIVFNEGYKPITRLDIIQRFLSSKEAPVVSFVMGLLSGEDNLGEKFKLTPEIVNRFIPMTVQAFYEAAREEGAPGALKAVPGIFGIGVNTYGKQIPTKGVTEAGNPKIDFRNPPSMGEDILNTITGTKVTDFSPEQQTALWKQELDKRIKQVEVDKKKRDALKQTNKEPDILENLLPWLFQQQSQAQVTQRGGRLYGNQ